MDADGRITDARRFFNRRWTQTNADAAEQKQSLNRESKRIDSNEVAVLFAFISVIRGCF